MVGTSEKFPEVLKVFSVRFNGLRALIGEERIEEVFDVRITRDKGIGGMV